MTSRDELELRAARDRVLDRLRHLGKTAPLQDVTVQRDSLVVPLDTPARVQIDPGQVDVRYMLRGRNGSGVGAGHVLGTGRETTVTTPPVTADVTYRVFARKVKPNEREVYLHDLATITVGLDTAIPARVTSETSLLHPTSNVGPDEPADSDPRVTDHGTTVQVELDRTQVGVDYDLVIADSAASDRSSTWRVASVDSVRGDGKRIVLISVPMFDDADLRVRVTRRFDAASEREDLSELFVAVMPLAVRADRSLRVSSPEPIVDQASDTSVVVRDTQVGVSYQLVSRTLHWDDFAYGAEDQQEPVIRVAVPDEADAMVRRPPLDRDGAVVPLGLVPVGTAQPGNAGDLAFDVTSLADDAVFVVIATKAHGEASSAVQIEQATAILTRPDPDRKMSLSVLVVESLDDGPVIEQVRLRDGQPGVLYFLRDEAGTDPRLPAYFPEPAQGEVQPRGVGRTRIGVDFVMAPNDHSVGSVIEFDAPQALPARLRLRAVKARTRVAVSMTDDAVIDAEPSVRLDEPDIVIGSTARIVVADSRPGERYQRLVDGVAVGNGRNGNGERVTLLTEALWIDTTIVLQATRSDEGSRWTIERLFALHATVRPEVDSPEVG